MNLGEGLTRGGRSEWASLKHEENLEGRDSGNHMSIWEESVPSRGMASAKALRWGVVEQEENGRRGGQRAAGTQTGWAIKLA